MFKSKSYCLQKLLDSIPSIQIRLVYFDSGIFDFDHTLLNSLCCRMLLIRSQDLIEPRWVIPVRH